MLVSVASTIERPKVFSKNSRIWADSLPQMIEEVWGGGRRWGLEEVAPKSEQAFNTVEGLQGSKVDLKIYFDRISIYWLRR